MDRSTVPFASLAGLQVNVAQLLKETSGGSRVYDVNVDLRGLDKAIMPRGPLQGTLKLMRTGEGILVTGQFHIDLELECTRCLEPFTAPVDFGVEEEFRPTIDIITGKNLPPVAGEDKATLIDEHHILDLSEVVRQDVIVAAPPYPVCRADCAGLCPHCGQNLNEGTCDCQESATDLRWEALRHLVARQDTK
jgi:uncharacterized protein